MDSFLTGSCNQGFELLTYNLPVSSFYSQWKPDILVYVQECANPTNDVDPYPKSKKQYLRYIMHAPALHIDKMELPNTIVLFILFLLVSFFKVP